MNSARENLGKILKQQRKSANLTLYELSITSGVSPSHLGRIENGERFPSAEILQRLARPLGFREEDLFALAGYLSARRSSEETAPVRKLDPEVERLLSREPVEIQRAAVGILNVLKSLALELNKPQNMRSENRSTPPVHLIR